MKPLGWSIEMNIIDLYRYRVKKALSLASLFLPSNYPFNKFSFNQGYSHNTIIGNAIPKSGTYLLESLLREISGCNSLSSASDNRTHILLHSYQTIKPDSILFEYPLHATRTFSKLFPGQSCAAHIPYDARVAQFFEANKNYKHIFMYRDIRDVLVSYVNFVTNSPNFAQHRATKRQQQVYKSINEDQRFLDAMERMPPHFFKQFSIWLFDENTLSISFESLYNELVNLDDSKDDSIVNNIRSFLGVDNSDISISKNVLGRGHTSSGNKDKFGQYKDKLSINIKEEYCRRGYPEVNSLFGYNS